MSNLSWYEFRHDDKNRLKIFLHPFSWVIFQMKNQKDFSRRSILKRTVELWIWYVKLGWDTRCSINGAWNSKIGMINDERVMTSGTRLLCTVVQNHTIKSHFNINAANRIDVPKVRLFIFVNRFVYLTSQKLRHQKVSLIWNKISSNNLFWYMYTFSYLGPMFDLWIMKRCVLKSSIKVKTFGHSYH